MDGISNFMNNKKQWTEAEDQFLLVNRNSRSCRDLADELKRTEKAVSTRLWTLGRKNPKNQSASPGLVGESEPAAQYWKRIATEAQRKLASRLHDSTAVEQLVEAAHELAPKAYSPPLTAPVVSKAGKPTPHSAVLVFSDCHIGQVVTKEQTLGLGNYSFEIFLRRLARLEHSIFSIVREHTAAPVSEIVIPMIGDLLHGNLAHAVEAGQTTTLFSQMYQAGHAIAQFLRNLSSLAPLRIYSACGNHTRMPNQAKMPVQNRFSNFDMVLMAYLEALLRDCSRIQFTLNEQPFATFEVAGHQFFAGHGDSLKGGDAILGIPNHALGRNLSNVAQNYAAIGRKFPNYFIFGHFHKPISLPHASGEIIINGGWPGVDNYAVMSAFNSSRPSQSFFLVHPRMGKSASYQIKLDLGDNTPHSYQLPNKFPCQ